MTIAAWVASENVCVSGTEESFRRKLMADRLNLNAEIESKRQELLITAAQVALKFRER